MVRLSNNLTIYDANDVMHGLCYLLFIGLHLENYIQPDLDNVEIRVLSGSVSVELYDADIPKNFTLIEEEKLRVAICF